MRRVFFSVGLAAGSSAAYAEAGKGLSRISTGEVLGFIFLAGFALPAGLGCVGYWLLRVLGRQPSLTGMIAGAIACWWLGLYLFFSVVIK